MSEKPSEYIAEKVIKTIGLYSQDSQEKRFIFKNVIAENAPYHSGTMENIPTFIIHSRGMAIAYDHSSWNRYIELWPDWKPVRDETTPQTSEIKTKSSTGL